MITAENRSRNIPQREPEASRAANEKITKYENACRASSSPKFFVEDTANAMAVHAANAAARIHGASGADARASRFLKLSMAQIDAARTRRAATSGGKSPPRRGLLN